MSFEFSTAGRIVFGAGVRAQAAEVCASFGRRALLVTGRTPSRAAWLRTTLEAAGVAVETMSIAGEPSVTVAANGAARARDSARDVVIAFGGGSAIDAAKAVAALAANPGDPFDYLEVVGHGRPLPHAALPVVALPTTAGTGSEATRNAVLTVPDRRVKVSLRHGSMLPRVAIVDPELTLDLPPLVTAATGLDALTQLIEPYVSSRANPMIDALCLAGIPMIVSSVRRVCAEPGDIEARTAMSLASLWSGMALANAGLGAVHGLAGPIGGMFAAPHGAVCAALLPHVCAANLGACRADGRDDIVARYETVARLITGMPGATAEEGIDSLRTLVTDLAIPPLDEYGITRSDLSAIVEHASRASSMKANPTVLSAAALLDVLSAASGLD